MKIISIANIKGGIGKTTLSHVLANGLKHKGYEVLAIDLDLQASLTDLMGEPNDLQGSYELLHRKASIFNLIRQTEHTDLIPASKKLAGIDAEIQALGKEYRLKEELQPVKSIYDYIIIDTPPTLSLVTTNALTASDEVIIPVQADRLSTNGIIELANKINEVQRYSNPDIKIAGIVIIRYNRRTLVENQYRELFDDLANQLNTKVFDTPIRESTVVRQAQALNEDIFQYAPKATVTADFEAFIEEYLAH